MTKRQIGRISMRVRRSLNGLYESYLAGMLRGMERHDRAIERALASLRARHPGGGEFSIAPPNRPSIVQRELKRSGDFGCARVREQLWQLQHLHADLSPAGEKRA